MGEQHSSPLPDPNQDDRRILPFHHRSVVDTSRPFRSVKEAVAVFGERFLVGEVYSSKTFSLPKSETPLFSDSETIKKLERELEEAKNEVKLLKEKEAKTDVVLASLNAELHKNMSKLAIAEAAKASSSRSPLSIMRDEEKKRDACWKMEQRRSSSPTLAEILNIGEREFLVGRRKMKKVVKKKPVIPLVGDLLTRKKSSSSDSHFNGINSLW